MKILYGIYTTGSIDVTNICLSKLTRNNIITIPFSDNLRAKYFTDPLPGIHKKIIILNSDYIREYDEHTEVKIDITNNTINTTNRKNIDEKLNIIHSSLKIKHGSLNDELPEQKMVVKYLTGNEKVLEIGGNIGRNSLVIASILKDSSNLVTLESDINIANQLIENRDLNNFNFYIENSALSKRRLIQKDWSTIPSDTLQEGYKWVNTITLEDFFKKYDIAFDTLVLDCEGSFYYILMDMPDILNDIKLIIMENDYWDLSHKIYINEIMIKNNFYLDYCEGGGWGPCYDNFFEVWKKSEPFSEPICEPSNVV
jgi:FkbM family methyltransferase